MMALEWRYIYTCLADFRKWYDSICRKRFLRKLKEIGLLGKTPDIIKSMYKPPKVSLIHQVKIGRTFPTKIALKQSDLFSIILSNIYITDLPERLPEDSRISDTINDTPYLDDTKISN